MISTHKHIENQVFGRLTAMYRVVPRIKRKSIWVCKCVCGNTALVRLTQLTSGVTQSCGCLRSELAANRARQRTIHGHARKRNETVEYRAWSHMKYRCYDKRSESYKDYGGRGIKVCDRWLESFSNFLEDMGLKPSPFLSIDRIENDGNYEPSNCRWATKSQQCSNQRRQKGLKHNGV